MRWIYRLKASLLGWFVPDRLDRELREELRFHFEMQVQANVDAGMSADEARRRARMAIGNPEPIREASRDGRAGSWLRQAGRDMSYGLRLLRKAPGFSAASIAIVALGIASVTAIFSVVYGIAIKPLPYREPERLVSLFSHVAKIGPQKLQVGAADYFDWRKANTVFEEIGIYRTPANFNLVGIGGEPERLFGARVTASVFHVLGVNAAIGRTFTEDENQIGHERAIILSHGLWQRRFAADASIVGRSINLSGVPHEVVGVMGPDFQYPSREYQFWSPLTINPAELTRQENPLNYIGIARLKSGISAEQAQAEMNTIASRLGAQYPANLDIGVIVAPTHQDLVGSVAPALSLMLAAVGCLLLVACFNLSNLLSSRAATRSRELAVRLALGATRGRVALQAVAEIVPLLVIGGAIGIAVAQWAINAFIPIAPITLPRVETIAVNGPVLAVTILALMLTGVLASLLPASQAWRSDLTSTTRDESRAIAGSRRLARARSILVAAQVALALPLLVAAVLLWRSFSNVSSIDPGFKPNGVLTMLMAVPRSKYTDDAKVADVTQRIIDQVSALPQVESAGIVSRLPLNGTGAIGMIQLDAPNRGPAQSESTDWRSATPGYFKTLGIPLIEGRLFDEHDTATSKPVGILDERIAKLVWPGESAVGKRFRIPIPGLPWVEVIGVVGHVKHDGLDNDLRPQVYWNHLQRAQDRLALVVKPKPGGGLTLSTIVNAIHLIDPEQPVYDVRPMEQVVEMSLAGRWLNTTLLVTFALMSLVLSCIGVYGVVAFAVTQQTREFGVRLALGASRNGIAAFVLRRGLKMAVTGSIAGLVLAALLVRGMATMLYGVSALDLPSFAAATAVLLLVALTASYLPARRASMVDPAVTLRGD